MRKQAHLLFFRFSLFLVALLIAFGFTAWYVTEYEAYDVVGNEWLSNPDFTKELKGWKVSSRKLVKQAPSGVVTLYSPAAGKYVALYQNVIVPEKLESEQAKQERLFLQLSGLVQTKGIQEGKKEWQQGRLALVFYNKEGKQRGTHAVPLPRGDHDWAYYNDVFEVPPDVHRIRVNVNILQVAGTVQVKQVGVVPVVLKAEAIYVQALGFLLWLLMAFWLMRNYILCLWQKSKIGLLFILALMMGAVVSGGIKTELTNLLPVLSYPITPSIMLDWDMLGHFTLFFVAAFWFLSFFHRKRWWQVAIDLMLLGLFIECLQLFVTGRTADVVDLWVDFLGTFIGIIFSVLWLKVRPKQQSTVI